MLKSLLLYVLLPLSALSHCLDGVASPLFSSSQASKSGEISVVKKQPSKLLPFDFYDGNKAALTDRDKAARAADMRMESQQMPNFAGKKVGEQALRFLGTPYRWGGVSEKTGMDCSGFALRAYQLSSGFLLPRMAREMARSLPRVNQKEMKTGDLVFFKTTGQFSHVGVYMGAGYFAHSPRAGTVARVDTLSKGYWRSRFEGARRPLQTAPQKEAFRAAEIQMSSASVSSS